MEITINYIYQNNSTPITINNKESYWYTSTTF